MRTRICLIAFLLMALIGGLFAQQPKSVGSELIQKLTFPEIKWQIPELGKEVTVDTLKNGIVLFMMEDHRLPIINIRGIVRTGSMYDPAGKEGLGSLTGTLIRMGGTTTLPADSLNAILEYLAASIETWIGSEQGGAYLNCLAKDLDRCLQIYADLLINPAFPQDKINLQKDKIKESIKRRNDTPSSIATREFWHLLYEDHPYGRILEWASIKNITREDLVAFHRTYFAPNNLWLGISGEFNIVELKS